MTFSQLGALALFACSLSACGASQTATREPDSEGHEEVVIETRQDADDHEEVVTETRHDADDHEEAVTETRREISSGCPSAFGRSPPSCVGGDDPGTCSYPEGTCSCAIPRWCGGAVPPPRPREWICERPREPCPHAGTACTGTGGCFPSACGYGVGVVCSGGVWTETRVPSPP